MSPASAKKLFPAVGALPEPDSLALSGLAAAAALALRIRVRR